MALGSMPPAHRLIFLNLRTWLRLNNFQTAPDNSVLPPPHLQTLYDDFINTGLAGLQLDAMPKQPNSALLNVTISEDGTDPQLPLTDIRIFTDGSKSDKKKQWAQGRDSSS
jgi:hypothetical protein